MRMGKHLLYVEGVIERFTRGYLHLKVGELAVRMTLRTARWHRSGLEDKRLGIGAMQSDGRYPEHIGGEDDERCQSNRECGGHKRQER